MPAITDTLAAIGTELAGLLSADSATRSMTLPQVVAYCKQQIDLAKSDSDPAPRIAALSAVVALAKAYTWEDGAAMTVPVFSGELSVDAQSAAAERIAEHPGMSLATAPGDQASPAGGAFEMPSGVAGPSGNTVRPAGTFMPPTFPQSEPAAGAMGFMAKAAAALAKSGDAAVLNELKAILEGEAKPGDGDALKDSVRKDDGWPLDLATKTFLEGKNEIPSEDDFGPDPHNLRRGKVLRD